MRTEGTVCDFLLTPKTRVPRPCRRGRGLNLVRVSLVLFLNRDWEYVTTSSVTPGKLKTFFGGGGGVDDESFRERYSVSSSQQMRSQISAAVAQPWTNPNQCCAVSRQIYGAFAAYEQDCVVLWCDSCAQWAQDSTLRAMGSSLSTARNGLKTQHFAQWTPSFTLLSMGFHIL